MILENPGEKPSLCLFISKSEVYLGPCQTVE